MIRTDAATLAGAPAISMAGVSRRFGETLALDGVDLAVRRGEVHALLGENGAGKTTLMRILAGLDVADEGEVRVGDELVTRPTPRSMIDRGVALVQQHFTLVGRLTAAQNLHLARPTGWRLPSNAAAAERLAELADLYGLPVRPGVPAGQLSVGEQQRLEVLRALDRNPSVLVLDEPTAVLTELEADGLLEVCRGLANEGRSVIIISHRLREILAGADRVTVLRRGQVVVAGDSVADHDRRSLAVAMVGDGVRGDDVTPPEHHRSEPRLVLAGAALGRLEPLDLTVRAGEIVGVAGVDGNGQTELEAILAGRSAPASGTVSLDGTPIAVGAPRRRVAGGVAYIAADRYRHAVVRAMSLADNVSLGRSGWWRPRPARQVAAVADRLDGWDVRGARAGRVGQLSGGNAQKLVLARELANPPSFVIAAHPTRGLDPGATAAVATRVLATAAGGAAVVWIGAELDELLRVSDRIVVLCTGHRPCEFRRPYDRHAIALAMAGVAA